jgi:hypothetical protein
LPAINLKPIIFPVFANRNLSLAEWKQYIGESTPYEKVCPDLPPGEGAPADSK